MGQLSVSRLETSVLGSSSPGGLEEDHLKLDVMGAFIILSSIHKFI